MNVLTAIFILAYYVLFATLAVFCPLMLFMGLTITVIGFICHP